MCRRFNQVPGQRSSETGRAELCTEGWSGGSGGVTVDRRSGTPAACGRPVADGRVGHGHGGAGPGRGCGPGRVRRTPHVRVRAFQGHRAAQRDRGQRHGPGGDEGEPAARTAHLVDPEAVLTRPGGRRQRVRERGERVVAGATRETGAAVRIRGAGRSRQPRRPVEAATRQPLQPGQQAGGQRRRRALHEHGLQATLGIGFGLALGAGGQVGQDALTHVVRQLAVHQGGKPVTQVLFGGGRTDSAHSAPPSLPAPGAPTAAPASARCSARAAGERCLSALRRCERPRWIRLRTVPSFTPSVAAISS